MPRRKRTGRDKTTRQESTTSPSDSFQKSASELAQQLADLQEALHLQERNAKSKLQEALHLQEQKTESRLQEALRLQEQRAATALHELKQQLEDKDDVIRTLQLRLQETQERMTAVEERTMFSEVCAQNETLQRLHERVEKTEISLKNALATFLPRVEAVLSTLEKPVLCTRKLNNYSCISTASPCSVFSAEGKEEAAGDAQKELSPPEVSTLSSYTSVANSFLEMRNKEETASALEFSSPMLLPIPSSTSGSSTCRMEATGEAAVDPTKFPPRGFLSYSSSISEVSASIMKDSREAAAGAHEAHLTPELPHHSSSSSPSSACVMLPTEEAATRVADLPETPLVFQTFPSSTSYTNERLATSSGKASAVLEEPPAPGESEFSSFAMTYSVELPKEETTNVQMFSLPGVHGYSSSTNATNACELSPAEDETSNILEENWSPGVPHTSSFPSTARSGISPTAEGAADSSVEAKLSNNLEEASDEGKEEGERQRVELRAQKVTLKMEQACTSPSASGEQLWEAAGEARLSDVRRLLDSGAPVNYTGRDGLTPLLRAACLGDNADVVSLLLIRGADCNSVNTYGCTAMHFAVSKDNSGRTVDLLIAAGAALNARNKAGVTPLHWAVARNNASAVRALLVAGARRDLKGWSGGWKNKTPLDLARSAVIRNLLHQ